MYWYDKIFSIITYTIDSFDWVDKKVVSGQTDYTCRVTEMSYTDLQKIWWDRDNDKQKRKLYTESDIIFEKWQIIKYDWKDWRVLRTYRPSDLTWYIPYSKVYIMEQ